MSQLRVMVSLMLMVCVACGGSGSSSNNQSNLPTDPSGGGSNTGGTTSHSLSVTVTNNAYAPGATTVARGSTVSWTWNACMSGGYGDECTAHTVTFDDGISSILQDKGTFSRMFDKAGTYQYHCQVHGSAMSGTVTVE